MCGGDSRAQGSWRLKLALQTKLWSWPGASQATGKADMDVAWRIAWSKPFSQHLSILHKTTSNSFQVIESWNSEEKS